MKKTPVQTEAEAEAALLAELGETAGSTFEAADPSADPAPPGAQTTLRPETVAEIAAAQERPMTAQEIVSYGGEPDAPAEELGIDPEDGQPRLHALLSNAEVHAIRDRARARVAKEKRDAAADELLAKEIALEKKLQGLITGSPEDELEYVYLDLAEHSDRITLNGTVYFHGRGYNVPRHVARTMKETMFRGWQHQIIDIDGKSRRDFFRRNYDTRINGRGEVVAGYAAQERAA